MPPKAHWTDRINYDIMGSDGVSNWFHHSKLIEATKGSGPVYNASITINLDVGLDETANKLEAHLGFRKVAIDLDDKDQELYLDDTGVVRIFANTFNKRIDLGLITTNPFLPDKITKLFANDIVGAEAGRGRVLILQSTPNGLNFGSFGQLESPLESQNYSVDVIEGYDYIVDQINSEHPSGRITLLEGPPGTGKSFFIRGLVHAVDAKFVVTPTNLLGEMSSPNFIPALVDLHEDEPYDVPIVLIVEDADSLIVDRKHGNMELLSTVLNIGDGIMGQLLDIRLLLSTNARSKIEIDQALLRPGRLNTQVVFEKLTYAHASKIFDRVKKDDRTLSTKKTEFTLAEVYGEAESSRAVGDHAIVQFGEQHGEYL